MAGEIARGEVRLYRFPHPDKERPVVVLTRESALGYLSRVTVAPVTSTIRGVPSEVVLNEGDGMKSPCAVNLHNLVTVSKEHVGRRLASLSDQRMREICAALGFALADKPTPTAATASRVVMLPNVPRSVAQTPNSRLAMARVSARAPAHPRTIPAARSA